MKWLIVEDALRDRKGHWLEWVTTFYDGFRELGDDVVVLADAEVEALIRDALQAEAVLPPSIWHRMGDGAGPLIRYSRVITHGWRTWRTMERYFRTHPDFDAIFVPTVLVHHLLAWCRLIKGTLRNKPTRVLLFFLTAPVRIEDKTGKTVSDGSPSARLMIKLLNWIEPEIKTGKVVLGVETKAMQRCLENVTGVPFVYFPQPVHPIAMPDPDSSDSFAPLEMGCYGAARAEKGSDILQEAIALHRRQYPTAKTRFTIQWIDDFTAGANRTISKSSELLKDSQVHFLTRYFVDGEYPRHLARTQVMLLPYRSSSYCLRGSRVVVEAVVNGIPVVATAGTTLAATASEFGSCVESQDGDPGSLARAIREAEIRFDQLRQIAKEKQSATAAHFSVETFRDYFNSRNAGQHHSTPTLQPTI